MDTRAFLFWGFICATTSGFIPRVLRRDDVVAQRVQQQESNETQANLDMSCRFRAQSCPPIRRMMGSMFSAHHRRLFITNNQLKFSCSADTKSTLDACASSVRNSCTGHSNWINGAVGFYDDLCAMESVLLRQAACMNSAGVSRTLDTCMQSILNPEAFCASVIPCLKAAFDSEPRCSLEFKTKFINAATAMFKTQFGACEVPAKQI